MKNGTIADKLRMQEQELTTPKENFTGEKKKIVDMQTDENVKTQTNKNQKTFSNTSIQQQISTIVNQSTNNFVSKSSDGDSLSSLFSILPSATDINPMNEQPPLKSKKKKKRRPRLS